MQLNSSAFARGPARAITPAMLRIEDLTYRIGGRLLFDGASLALANGRKAGLVGRNGSGKTTLFRLIEGVSSLDGGEILLTGRARVGSVAQEAPGGPESLLDTVLAADRERADLLARAESESDGAHLAEIHARLAHIGADGAPARAHAILAGLGFDQVERLSACASFSGGWRMRVALVAALFSRPDLLLLDEPSNHLDLEATTWLEGHLAKWPGSLLLVSHERDLLNRVVDEIFHLEGGRLRRYVGGYDAFEKTRAERLDLESRAAKRQRAERKRIEAFVERFRYKATKARQAQSRLKMLERMTPIQSVIEERAVNFQFPDTPGLAPPVIALDGAAAGYEPGKPIIRDLNLRIDMDDRIALLGANGNGKSTLIKLLAGRLEAEAGRLTKARKLKIGYFAQHQTEELDPEATPFTHLRRLSGDGLEARLRAHLGRFGFVQERADTRAKDLSGGEKARLLFALMSIEAPHILLLDEPTNHLDMDARDALVQALNAFQGAVVLVSHDSRLINLVCERLWLVAEGGCRPFEGDLEEYRRYLMGGGRSPTDTPGKDQTDGNGGANRKSLRRARARRRAELGPLREAARAAEKRVSEINTKRQQLEGRLLDPGFHENLTDPGALQKEMDRLGRDLERAEAAWVAAAEALEQAEQSDPEPVNRKG